MNQAASTRFSGDDKEKLSTNIRSEYASDFCHDRKSALTRENQTPYCKKPGPRHDGIRQRQENKSSDTESSADEEYFYAVNSTKPAKEIPCVDVNIQGNKFRMTVDTGATINVLDRLTFDQMTNIFLQPTDLTLKPMLMKLPRP